MKTHGYGDIDWGYRFADFKIVAPGLLLFDIDIRPGHLSLADEAWSRRPPAIVIPCPRAYGPKILVIRGRLCQIQARPGRDGAQRRRMSFWPWRGHGIVLKIPIAELPARASLDVACFTISEKDFPPAFLYAAAHFHYFWAA